MPRKTTPAEQRFWAKVNKLDDGNGCWEWTAGITNGYGNFISKKPKMLKAHRFSYELAKGPIPEGLHIDHLCCNRKCVNPDHLEAVTQAENNRRCGLRKTKCTQGHPYPQRTDGGRRSCKECKRIYDANRSKKCRQI